MSERLREECPVGVECLGDPSCDTCHDRYEAKRMATKDDLTRTGVYLMTTDGTELDNERWMDRAADRIAELEAERNAEHAALAPMVAADSVGGAVSAWLLLKGCDGLAGVDCGCRHNKLFLCERADGNCLAARYVYCGDCERWGCDDCTYPHDDADGCFIPARAAIEQATP